jgi:hypothetical protein
VYGGIAETIPAPEVFVPDEIIALLTNVVVTVVPDMENVYMLKLDACELNNTPEVLVVGAIDISAPDTTATLALAAPTETVLPLMVISARLTLVVLVRFNSAVVALNGTIRAGYPVPDIAATSCCKTVITPPVKSNKETSAL